MLKWFRKYRKHLMAGVVAFLMVSFLIQSELTERSNERRFGEWGKLEGKVVKTDILLGPEQTRVILERLGINWRMPWYLLLNRMGLSPQQFPDPPKPLNSDTFALLWLEAERAGLVDEGQGSEEDLRNMVGEVRLNEVRRDFKLSDIQREIGRYLRIMTHARMAMDAVHVTDGQVRQYVRDTQETVSIAYVKFPAEQFVDDGYMPPDAEIAAHFDKYRDTEKPADERGFGYRWPRRVVLETLRISLADVERGVQLKEEEIRKHYRENRASYTRIEDPSTQPASTQRASTQAAATSSAPASGPIVKQLTLAEARSKVEEELRSRLALSRTRDFMDQIQLDLAGPWIHQARGESGYPSTAPGVDVPGYMEQAAKRYSERFGVKVNYEKTAPLTLDDFNNDKKWDSYFGGMEQNRPMRLGDAVFRVPGFFDAKEAGETAMRLALYQPSDMIFLDEDLTGKPRSALIVRVVETHEPEAPKTVAEVRDKIVADLRKVKADAVAQQMAERLYAVARVSGLKPAIDADPALKKMLAPKPKEGEVALPTDVYMEPPPFPRRDRSPLRDEPAYVPGFGSSETAVADCFSLTQPNWISEPSSQPAATQPGVAATQPSPKVRIVQLPESRSRVVVELKSHKPVREDEYDSMKRMNHNLLKLARCVIIAREWFDADKIMKRVQFEPAHPASFRAPDDEQ